MTKRHLVVHHIDGNLHNNALANLRIAPMDDVEFQWRQDNGQPVRRAKLGRKMPLNAHAKAEVFDGATKMRLIGSALTVLAHSAGISPGMLSYRVEDQGRWDKETRKWRWDYLLRAMRHFR